MSDTVRILHLSDPHLTRTGFDGHGVPASAALTGIIHELETVPTPDLLVVSGDLADDGSTDGYRCVLDLVAETAARLDVPHVYSMGNHDNRDSFETILGSGHRLAGEDVGRLTRFSGGRVRRGQPRAWHAGHYP